MGCFSPVTSSVQSNHRPVSYYALLKGWLPPSPPSGCHQPTTSFPTKQPLWDLNVRSGLFPSRLWTLAPKVCLLVLHFVFFPERKKTKCKGGIRSFLGISKALGPPFPKSALPPPLFLALYLNRFRRKPAISEFVWHFTAIQRSSPPIATDVGSVLQKVLPFLQPALG